jgi:signal transduction histidine kinase
VPPDLVFVGRHDPRLVVLSVLVSILAAYAAHDLSERVRDARGRAWLAWLVGGATANGIGTWSMHYTAMLGFQLPVPVGYDWPTVVLSLVVGVVGAAAALLVVSRAAIRPSDAVAASVFMGGVGISVLHYTAMAAMRLPAIQHHSPALVAAAVGLAIAFSLMALALMFLVPKHSVGRRIRHHGSAVLRGTANPAMHYTAMAGVVFTLSADIPDTAQIVSIQSIGVVGISIVPVMVLVVALLTSLADRLQRQRTEVEESRDQLRALAGRLQAVREEERTRLAREIHDVMGQALTAIKIEVTGLLRQHGREEGGDDAGRSQPVVRLLDEAIHAVRRIVSELRPGILDQLGLVAALEWAAEEFQARTGIRVRFRAPDASVAIEPERAAALFRIFQEALTNVSRHARATEVDVRLTMEGDTLILRIQDNGRGITEEESVARTSLGILGMRERAVLLGGELTIRGSPGHGTTVTARIPGARV